MTRRAVIVKWVAYALLTVAVFLVQEYLFPNFEIFGVSPILMGSLAVCVGMYEGAAAGAVYGAVAGVMMYAHPGSAELMYALIFGAGGAAAGVLCEHVLTKGLPSALLGALAANSLATLMFFVFVMWLPGRAELAAFVQVGLVEIAYSTAGVLLVYPAVRLIVRASGGGEGEER